MARPASVRGRVVQARGSVPPATAVQDPRRSRMSVGEIAGLIAAIAFVALVALTPCRC